MPRLTTRSAWAAVVGLSIIEIMFTHHRTSRAAALPRRDDEAERARMRRRAGRRRDPSQPSACPHWSRCSKNTWERRSGTIHDDCEAKCRVPQLQDEFRTCCVVWQVAFASDCIGEEVQKGLADLKNGEVRQRIIALPIYSPHTAASQSSPLLAGAPAGEHPVPC